jgi:hypothetical protein
MIPYTSRILLGATLALLVGTAGAQNAPDGSSRMPAEKGTTNTMPAQPSQQPTDKMSADPNGASQGATAQQSTTEPTQSTSMRHARKSAPRQHEAVSFEEKSYRQALRQCVQEKGESQRDVCIDNAIGQHEPNG